MNYREHQRLKTASVEQTDPSDSLGSVDNDRRLLTMLGEATFSELRSRREGYICPRMTADG